VDGSAFPNTGVAHGPIVQRYWLYWGQWVVFPAPPPCFECPKFRADVAHRLTKSVAVPIVDRLKRWKAEGKDYLFAGIAVGNETQVPDYRMPGGREPEGLDRTRTPPAKIRMRREEMVRTGYASLHRRGYTTQSVEQLAKRLGKSVDEVVTELLYEVAHDYVEFGAKTLKDAGIPRERLYTHFTSPFRRFLEKMIGSEASLQAAAGSASLPPPVQYAVNAYSRPGFTVSRGAADLQDLAAQVVKARGSRDGDRAWAAVETYAVTGEGGAAPRPQTQEQFETFLGALVANGARVVNVYAVDERAQGVIRAIREWLSGKDLPSTWTEPQPRQNPSRGAPPSIVAKMEKFQREMERAKKGGKDLAPVGKIMQEFGALMHEGKVKEAEALLDRALERIATEEAK